MSPTLLNVPISYLTVHLKCKKQTVALSWIEVFAIIADRYFNKKDCTYLLRSAQLTIIKTWILTTFKLDFLQLFYLVQPNINFCFETDILSLM